MTLRLLIDECASAATLRRLLIEAGHYAITAVGAGLQGADDDDVFAYAVANSLSVLTKNPSDFVHLHQRDADHPGIFLIYQDNDVTRDMTDREIVRALENLLTAGVPIARQLHALNHWRY